MTILTIGVSDLPTMTAFYEDVFGWKKTAESNEGISFFKLNGILLSLYPRYKLAEDAGVSSEANGFKGFTLAYCTRTKDEVDQFISELSAKGVLIVKAPEEAFWGGYSSYVADPDGNLWEIAYNPFLNMDEAGNAKE